MNSIRWKTKAGSGTCIIRKGVGREDRCGVPDAAPQMVQEVTKSFMVLEDLKDGMSREGSSSRV